MKDYIGDRMIMQLQRISDRLLLIACALMFIAGVLIARTARAEEQEKPKKGERYCVGAGDGCNVCCATWPSSAMDCTAIACLEEVGSPPVKECTWSEINKVWFCK